MRIKPFFPKKTGILTYPAARKNAGKLVDAGTLKEWAGTSKPKDFVAGEFRRLLDEPLTEMPTSR